MCKKSYEEGTIETSSSDFSDPCLNVKWHPIPSLSWGLINSKSYCGGKKTKAGLF